MNQAPKIPYRFAFGPPTVANDPDQPYINQNVALFLSIQLPIIGTDPDSLCRSVAMSLKAICRPQAVAQIAEQLQDHLIKPKVGIFDESGNASHVPAGVSPDEPSTQQEPTMPKITIGAPAIDQPIPADPRDPEVEITPAGTKLTQLNFESQLSNQATLPNLDPLSEEAPK